MVRILSLLIILPATFGLSRQQPVSALSINQQHYLDHIRNDEVRLVFGLGSAGCGKTFLACRASGEQKRRIIITKPFVSVGNEEMGHLPGNLNEKISPWVESILSNFDSSTRRHVEIAPMGFMRGHSFENTIIIADEMQNCTPEQMLMLLTRMGSNSKLIVTGDLMQKDVRQKSGIEDFLNRYDGHSSKIKIVEFNIDDVKRDEFTKDILRIYSAKRHTPCSTLSIYGS